MFLRSWLVLCLGMGLSGHALASTHCTDAPKTQWQKQDDFKAKLQKEGYQIQKFKITEGNCYEIYGKDKSGKKVEIYFNPTNGDVVKQKGE